MEKPIQSKEVVQNFFNAFGKGDIQGIVNVFDERCSIYAVRNAERNNGELYGTYNGRDGVRTFVGNLGKTFDTKAFTIDHIVGEGNVAFASGTFTHIIRKTDKPFQSAWSLMCKIKDGKIVEYRFYEDSAKFEEASSK